MPTVEISVDSVEAARAAEQGGAHRIELCSALAEGGITPSLGLLRAVRNACTLPIFVIIRPRGGDFLYSPEEFGVMRDDIGVAAEAGADGVVLGILTAAGTVDVARTRELVQLARPMQVTFHRAFDMVRDLDEALADTLQTGVDRILTSAAHPSAVRGKDALRRLALAAGQQITLLAGGGVRPDNIAELAQATGITEFHSSLRRVVGSSMQFRTAGVQLGSQGADEYARTTVLAEDVQALVSALDNQTAAISAHS